MADGELNYDITANSRGFERPLSDANAMIGRLGGGIRGLIGPMAAVAGISGGLAGIGKAIGGAAEIENLGIAFEVMTGSAEKGKRLLEDIRTLGASTPYEFPGLAKGGQTLLNFGIAAEEVIPTLSMLGDIAAGDEQKLGSLALVFGQIASTGRLMGGDLLQLINAGFNPLQVISERTGESMASLKDRMEAGAISLEEVKGAFVAATSEGGAFFGMMEKQSGTNTGLLSTLKDEINSVFITLGTPINDALKPVLEGAIENVRQVGAGLAAAVEIAQSALANGSMGEILALSLKLAAVEYLNAMIASQVRIAKTLGEGLMTVISEVSKALSVGLLSASQLLRGDMYESVVQIANNVKSAFSWAMSEAVALFEAQAFYTVGKLKEAIGKIPLIGKGLEGFKAGSFQDILSQRRQANAPDLNINTRPIDQGVAWLETQLGKASAGLEAWAQNLLDGGEAIATDDLRKDLAGLFKDANPDAFQRFLAAMKDAPAPIKEATEAAAAAIAKDLPQTLKEGTETGAEEAAEEKSKIRVFGLAESEDRRKARMSQADKDKLAAGGSLLGAATASPSGLLPRAAAAAAAGTPAVTPPITRGRAAEAARATPEASLLSVLKEIAGNTASLKQLATA